MCASTTAVSFKTALSQHCGDGKILRKTPGKPGNSTGAFYGGAIIAPDFFLTLLA